MPLNNIDRVRSLIGDINKYADKELVGRGPVSDLRYQVDMYPIRTGSYTVFVSGTVKASATATLIDGLIDFTGVATAITANAEVRSSYRWNHLADDEIQSVIDVVSGTIGDRFILAASIAARGLAGNQARHFSYRIGEKEVDKNEQADKWLKLADSLDNAYQLTVKFGNMNVSMASNDSSGTPFDSYDTGVASSYQTGGSFGQSL